MLSWLHIGDLHITEAGLDNDRDLRRIVDLANAVPPGSLDFALLPGDVADDGTPEQFGLVADAVRPLRLPLHILPGDHDFKPRNLDAFHRVLGARPLPYVETVKGVRCLFLDVVSAGSGGPDFRMDEEQLDWVEREVAAAAGRSEHVAVFMHTYPADLRAGAEGLGRLLRHPAVLCVDMGHTHYNELAQDGATVFMATRSTGQIEEGPPGFSITALDGGVVSWRFKPLQSAWPFVLITAPADRRLAIRPDQAVSGPFTVRAKVIADRPVRTVELRADDGDWSPMTPAPDGTWQAQCAAPAAHVEVRATDEAGRQDSDHAEPASAGWTPGRYAADGSDADRLGEWQHKGILGTQLGPNRNGRKW